MNGRYTLINLHPTMYLLIHKSCNKGYEFLSHLHPTMYLLIPDAKVRWHHHVINLHPTMYLLILLPFVLTDVLTRFTSHYVSINFR